MADRPQQTGWIDASAPDAIRADVSSKGFDRRIRRSVVPISECETERANYRRADRRAEGTSLHPPKDGTTLRVRDPGSPGLAT